MFRTLIVLVVFQLLSGPALARTRWAPQRPSQAAARPVHVDWYADYAKAMKAARAQRKMLFIWFQAPQPNAIGIQLETAVVRNPKVLNQLKDHVALKLPADAQIIVEGRATKILGHPAFEELQGQPGIAILDFAHRATSQYGHLVTALPFASGKYYRFQPDHLAVALDLPPGTLTQRTLVFAVRIHPEAPASTGGELDATLSDEARRHSLHQARIRRSGHHNWGSRFPRLSALLPFGLRAQEIVAESWPHESLVDAAVDCVDSWRQSSGHWNAVRSSQPRFGYDMQRGSNGIWYATGLFGNNR
ncbi:MAG TPA: hypothetical protein VN699_10855 [Pirellulales bacterium]|nr:hypothetical protein [Pirellulales bacterium]